MFVISILIRTAVLYLFVTLAIRLMGKRQIGDMQPNELVITLLISEIAAIPLQDAHQPIINGVAAVSVLVVLEIIVSVLSIKSMFMRKLLSGSSVILIENGKINQKALKQVRLTVIELIELLRGENVFDITEVAFAVLEVNGNLSVVPKSAYKSVQLSDIPNLKQSKATLPLPVISDGKIVKETLNSLNVSEKQIKKVLGKNSISDVFLMTLDLGGNNTVILKEEKQ